MNEAVAINAQRAVPMARTFSTWRLSENGTETRRRYLDAATLDEAVRLATPPPMVTSLARGGFPGFVILETDDTARDGKARHMLHCFTVKVRREWRAVGPGRSAQQVAVPYAVRAGSLPMNAFEPRRPFDACQDDAVTGRQSGEAQLLEIGARP